MSNVLLGCAIGDALGKFAESKLPDYQPLLDWDGKTFLPSIYHKLEANQYTDDTMMSIAVAESLVTNNGFNPDDLSKRYIELFTSNTIRGYGRTTKLAIDNLISGKHWSESGVIGSYGNGVAMRVAPLGVYFRDDFKSLIEAVKIDNAMTHNSNESEAGALAIAITTAWACNNDTEDLIDRICDFLPNSEVKNKIKKLDELIFSSSVTNMQVLAYLGVRADVRMTAPSVLFMYLSYSDNKLAVEDMIRAAGDCDTNAAILNSIYGAEYGLKSFDEYHIENVENRDYLIELDYKLYNRINNSQTKLFPRN